MRLNLKQCKPGQLSHLLEWEHPEEQPPPLLSCCCTMEMELLPPRLLLLVLFNPAGQAGRVSSAQDSGSGRC